jgi:hypothetical protein
MRDMKEVLQGARTYCHIVAWSLEELEKLIEEVRNDKGYMSNVVAETCNLVIHSLHDYVYCWTGKLRLTRLDRHENMYHTIA